MLKTRRVKFHYGYAPYYPGDVAGIAPDLAEKLLLRGIISYEGDVPAVDFDRMDRPALLTYAREHLGIAEVPPKDVSDDELRDALRAAEAGTPQKAASDSTDTLDVMDRVHLEAFAKTKCKMDAVDPALPDDALRDQIRAVAGDRMTEQANKSADKPKGKGRS